MQGELPQFTLLLSKHRFIIYKHTFPRILSYIMANSSSTGDANVNKPVDASELTRRQYRNSSFITLLFFIAFSLLLIFVNFVFTPGIGGNFSKEAMEYNTKMIQTREMVRFLGLIVYCGLFFWFIKQNWGYHQKYFFPAFIKSLLLVFSIISIILVILMYQILS